MAIQPTNGLLDPWGGLIYPSSPRLKIAYSHYYLKAFTIKKEQNGDNRTI